MPYGIFLDFTACKFTQNRIIFDIREISYEFNYTVMELFASLALSFLSAALSVSSPADAFISDGAAPEVMEVETDAGYRHLVDISYVSGNETDEYRLERCRLDIYYPENTDGFATLVWFHGGGLEAGSKSLLPEFRNQGFAVVDVNYRLSPKARCPAYIEDAAQAMAWVFEHIEEYGGSPDQIYVGGHSAGGYLSLMVALAGDYMAEYGADADRIAKAYPVSGQTATHYTVKSEKGLSRDIPVIDEFAPSNNVRKEGAPIMLITGDDDLEMLARYEENLHLYALLKFFGHPAELYQLEGFNHGNVIGPACYLVRDDITRLWREYKKSR